ncbi:MAG TPA: DNA mismatch repair protein MutT [Candidatus Magasanikbacteria bacterium]|nr:DNA mismatch repair protein MutT [Candidatus Magasanikbacteria bacterium]
MKQTIICSGPVIIESDKVLLVREQKSYGITPWLFPGGKAEPNETDPLEICRREAKEEVGIDLEIIKQLTTTEASSWRGLNKKYILYHYLAKRIGEIKPGEDIVEWAWIDINNLPKDCNKNVYEIIVDYKNML